MRSKRSPSAFAFRQTALLAGILMLYPSAQEDRRRVATAAVTIGGGGVHAGVPRLWIKAMMSRSLNPALLTRPGSLIFANRPCFAQVSIALKLHPSLCAVSRRRMMRSGAGAVGSLSGSPFRNSASSRARSGVVTDGSARSMDFTASSVVGSMASPFQRSRNVLKSGQSLSGFTFNAVAMRSAVRRQGRLPRSTSDSSAGSTPARSASEFMLSPIFCLSSRSAVTGAPFVSVAVVYTISVGFYLVPAQGAEAGGRCESAARAGMRG
jgi:hypothetical protein